MKVRSTVGVSRLNQLMSLWVGCLKKRATPFERRAVCIFQKAGARVRFNANLQDMNSGVSSVDERRLEVLAQNCFGGRQFVELPRRTTAARSEGGRSSVGATTPRQRRNLPRAGRVGEVPFGGPCHRNWRSMERGSSAHVPTARARAVPWYMANQVALPWERCWTRMLATTCAVPLGTHRPAGARFAVVQVFGVTRLDLFPTTASLKKKKNTVDRVFRAHGEMKKNKANGPGDCLVTEILRELPRETVHEITHWFGKDSEGNVELQQRGTFNALFVLKKPTRS